MRLPGWVDSVRANLAIMAMFLIFVIVVGDMAGHSVRTETLAYVGGTLTGIIMSYYGKRDTGEENSRNTDTTTKSTVTTESQTK